jgi:hypothetical protein
MVLVCDKCGTIFKGPFSGTKGVTLTIERVNIICPNPKCRALVDISGIWQFKADGIAQLLRAPEFTPEVLQRLLALSRMAERLQMSVDEIKMELNKISPAASKLEKYLPSERLTGFLMLLAYIIVSMLEQCGSKGGDVINYSPTYNIYNSPERLSIPFDSSGVQDNASQKNKKPTGDKPIRGQQFQQKKD